MADLFWNFIEHISNDPYLFLPWPLPETQAMVLWPPCWNVTHSLTHHFTEQTRTDMSGKPETGVEE